MELLNYLRDSFNALKKSLGAISEKNIYDPIEGLGNTRLGVGIVSIWHVGDHYGQVVILLTRKRHRAASKPTKSPS
jgi:hypothetical protein